MEFQKHQQGQKQVRLLFRNRTTHQKNTEYSWLMVYCRRKDDSVMFLCSWNHGPTPTPKLWRLRARTTWWLSEGQNELLTLWWFVLPRAVTRWSTDGWRMLMNNSNDILIRHDYSKMELHDTWYLSYIYISLHDLSNRQDPRFGWWREQTAIHSVFVAVWLSHGDKLSILQ